MSEKLVEAIARAMEPSAFATFDRGHTVQNYLAERAFLGAEKTVRSARRKVRAALAAIKAEGYAVLPREPTEAMVRAACDSCDTTPAGEWRAMVEAAE